MLRIYTDFNARTKEGMCWLLRYDVADLEMKMKDLKLTKGDKVILYQDEGDFEVGGTLDFSYVDMLNRETWVAIPDWSTLIRK